MKWRECCFCLHLKYVNSSSLTRAGFRGIPFPIQTGSLFSHRIPSLSKWFSAVQVGWGDGKTSSYHREREKRKRERKISARYPPSWLVDASISKQFSTLCRLRRNSRSGTTIAAAKRDFDHAGEWTDAGDDELHNLAIIRGLPRCET